MKQFFLNNKSNDLLVFFCGWGMDETPFLSLGFSTNVLFLYDYANLDFDFDFSPYENIKLLAFSYGVYAAGLCAGKMPGLSGKIAINGTLIPVDNNYGVPVKKFALTEKMNSESIGRFRERLFYKKEDFEIFNIPKRTAESCTNELMKIKEIYFSNPVPELKFDKIYVSKYDKIVPAENQLNFWRKYYDTNITELENGHFPFYSYKIEDLLC
jgi:biotin synthesis protein BioG